MQSDMSLKEITGLLGFSSIEYFHHFFKRHNGMAPETVGFAIERLLGSA